MWGVVVIAVEVTIAVALISFGLYIILFPKEPKKPTAEDLMLRKSKRENNQ